ncbi:hypothetical protein BH11PLA2_BH11PLA2_37010 [soil metagenome]
MGNATRFRFTPGVSVVSTELTLHLAMFAVEGLVGRVAVRLDTRYAMDVERNVIAIDCRTFVGQLVTRVFAGLLLREIGETAFDID